MNIPEGWKLVPIEPTNEMLAATSGPDQHAYNNYVDMVEAAPTPPAPKQEVVDEYSLKFHLQKHGIPYAHRTQPDKLREATRLIATALQADEWAEHADDSDPDVASLEHEITRLVGDANRSARLRKAAEEVIRLTHPGDVDEDPSQWLGKLASSIENLRAALEGE